MTGRIKPQEPLIVDVGEGGVSQLAADTAPAIVDEDAGDGGVVNEDSELNSLPERAVSNADGTVKLPLRVPIALRIRSARGGERTETFSELTFYRLTGADLRAAQAASEAARPAVLLARATHVREPVMNALFDRMDAADLADATKVIESFFPSGPKTGK